MAFGAKAAIYLCFVLFHGKLLKIIPVQNSHKNWMIWQAKIFCKKFHLVSLFLLDQILIFDHLKCFQVKQ